MIVVAIIGLLSAVAVPAMLRARKTSQRGACLNNLRQIDYGKSNYAIELGFAPSTVAFIVPTYLKRTPICPSSGTYTVNDLATLPTCTIGAGHIL